MIDLWIGNPPSESGLIGDEIKEAGNAIVSNVTQAKLNIFSPDEVINTGVAAIICPGGAYTILSMTLQGTDFAKWLTTIGITAIVLKYRIPNGHKEIPLDDVQEAMRYTYANADELGIDISKIGVIGFSAGGHLAGLASTLFSDEITRPKFSILFYPIITMGEGVHEETKINLLGNSPSTFDIDEYSCEKQVKANTPPTLIFTSDDDSLVPPINSTMYYNALKKQGISASLHIFPQGDHAWGIKGKNMFGKDFLFVDEVKSLINKWIIQTMKL